MEEFLLLSLSVQKFISCISIAGMVAFVAFTVVSARELDTAGCRHVNSEGGEMEYGDYERISDFLFFAFFAMVTAVAWARDTAEDSKDKEMSWFERRLDSLSKWFRGKVGMKKPEEDNPDVLVYAWRHLLRLAFGEGVIILTAFVLAMTVNSKCPQSVGVSTEAQMDLNFIDEAAYFQGLLVVVLSSFLAVGVVAAGINAAYTDKSESAKRDSYENWIFFIAFLLLCMGTSGVYNHDGFHKRYENVTGIFNGTGINGPDLRDMCTTGDNQPHMWLLPDDKTVYLIMAILAGAHAGVTAIYNVNIPLLGFSISEGLSTYTSFFDRRKTKGIRVVLETVVQMGIAIAGIFVISPLIFILQNPPCNYAFEDLIHDDDGATKVLYMMIGYFLFVGTQTLKIYREFVETPEKQKMEKNGANALLLG